MAHFHAVSETATAAWEHARVAVIDQPSVHILGVDGFTDGVYWAVLPEEEGPPLFVSEKRWLYVDAEGRWRVAYTKQKDRQLGGNAGFLRSGVVAPGTLPACAADWERFTGSGWRIHAQTTVNGARYEHDWPDLAITVCITDDDVEGLADVRCYCMSGNELLSMKVDASKERLSAVRAILSDQLHVPRNKVKLVTHDGQLLEEVEGQRTLSEALPRSG